MNTDLQIIEDNDEIEMDLAKTSGKFIESLTRKNSKIKHDRALSIFENAKRKYTREVEDLNDTLTTLKRQRSNMLDLSPSDALNLNLAKDFNAEEWVKKDIAISLEIRNVSIALSIAEARVQSLFCKKIPTEEELN